LDKQVVEEIKKTKTALGYDQICENISDSLLRGEVIPFQVLQTTLQNAANIAAEILTDTIFLKSGKPYGV
jgi:hypothetical protein